MDPNHWHEQEHITMNKRLERLENRFTWLVVGMVLPAGSAVGLLKLVEALSAA